MSKSATECNVSRRRTNHESIERSSLEEKKALKR
nr:MAG TPA: hypothetical protein [Caudoviricetes sp.]